MNRGLAIQMLRYNRDFLPWPEVQKIQEWVKETYPDFGERIKGFEGDISCIPVIVTFLEGKSDE